MTTSRAYVNGHPATVDDLAPLAFAGFAHFTAMQVRDRAARGLDLHLQRLRTASDQLFGHHRPDHDVRAHLRAALGPAPGAVSASCFITPRPGEPLQRRDIELDVLVKITDAADPPAGPLNLAVVEHERHLPRIKHVGEVAKTQYLREAAARGFDDAAFVDSSGRLSEATIWNLAFWDGHSVIWPDAEVLPGVTMQILSRRLRALGVPQQTRALKTSDLGTGVSAVVMNSWSPGIPVGRFEDQHLEQDAAFVDLLHRAYLDEPLAEI